MKNVLIALVCFACGLFVAWFGVVRLNAQGLALHSHGRDAVATVAACTQTESRARGGTYVAYDVDLQYDGFEGRVTLAEPREVGSNVPVVYLPETPATVALGRQTDPAWKLAYGDEATGLGMTVGLTAFAGLFFVAGAVFLTKRSAP